MRKLNLSSPVELARYAIRNEMIELRRAFSKLLDPRALPSRS
jgi:hypothetical protein